MIELTFEYWNKLAEQTITISSLLGGFSIAVIANFLVSDLNTKLSKSIMAVSTLAASFFLITIFAMTNLLMKTTVGYPFKVVDNDLMLPRVVGVIAFFIGIISLVALISMSGWTKSKKMGRFTTILGTITLLLILLMIT
ncbi:hypothetical protein N9438_03985 [Flavobacteriaceae bacterium]|jgi:hypothetical protein|nr:hypothetical protein [Flavobacteriaceae bacterium]|tara:strand:+ start:128 stop:544 length:417 start_codon:yes stop_codon:yes gene_type:complete